MDGEPAHFRTDAERALLAYLAVHQGIPQRRDMLAALLAPDRPNAEALTYLRNRLTRLRRALGDAAAAPSWFEVDRKQIALRSHAEIGVDLAGFEQLLAAVAAHPHRQLAGCPACLARLQDAVDLVRGELLAGLNFRSDAWEAWLQAQRAYVQQRTLEAMAWLRNVHMAQGEWPMVLAVAQRELALEPWLEAAHRAAMTAHYHRGDRTAALAQFAHCEAQLAEELGVPPEAETLQLRQQILDHALAPARTEARDNLPLQTSRFFGRHAEQALLIHQLADPAYRLVTLVGAGGMGKTRLAIEVGRQVNTSFPNGVWFVPVDAVQGGAEQIKIAVGEAAGFGQADKQLTGDQVLAILRDKQVLLILDNCEVALEAVDFVPAWLRRAPGVAILATSRVPLNFAAEAVLLLDGLPTSTEDMDSGALRAAEALFAEQASKARGGFVVTAENLPQVRAICALVDGSRLGIALAAARVRRRSLQQIHTAIGHSLDFLSTRLRDVDPRHRSMRAVFETSWTMLESPERAVLAALSVFPTTFSAAAAATVARASLDELDLLCERSLLQQQHEQERYIMHSLLRRFAAAKLAERTPAVTHAFVDYFFQFAQAHQKEITQLQPEWRNFLAAITQAHAQAAWPVVLGLVQLLDEPWFCRIRFNDMRAGLALALDAAQALDDQPALAQILLRLSEIELEQNDYASAATHLAQAVQHFFQLEDGLGIAQAKYFLGRMYSEQALDEQAAQLLMESKRLFEEEEHWLGVAKNLNLIALCHIKTDRDFAAARVHLEESLRLQAREPLSATHVETLRHLARVKTWAGDLAAAEQCLLEASNLSEQWGDMGEHAAVLYERLLLSKQRQAWDEALTSGYACLETFRKLGSLRWEALVKTQLGLLHQARQEPQLAEALLTESLQAFGELGDLYEQAYSYYYLSGLYAELDAHGQSLRAKEQARRLNHELRDPQLQERLA